MITCRVCEQKSDPCDDAILLCGVCRSQSDALTGDITEAYEQALAAVAAALCALSPIDQRRAIGVAQAEIQAEQTETVARWERRVQATIDQGGPLAAYLELRLRYRRTRAWAAAAREELAMLTELEAAQ